MPSISVIMPVYNNEKYFPKAVERVLNQSFKDIELIIVDDGSTDNTGRIADMFAQKDMRVRVIHQENQWVYASYNNGVKQALGEYTLIINSDDLLRENALQVLADNITKYEPDVIWAVVLTHLCDEKQHIQVYDQRKQENRIKQNFYFKNQQEVRENWIHVLENSYDCNQINLYKTSLIKQHLFCSNKITADQLFNIEIASDIQKALVIKDTIYDHFLYEQGMNASLKYYAYIHTVFNELYLEYKKVFSEWGVLNNNCMKIIAQRRMRYLTSELNSLRATNCNLTIEQKLKRILTEYIDDVILECATILCAEEELESRILSSIRALLIQENLKEDSEMYFIYELLESLLKYEKSEIDYIRMQNAIENSLNPKKIGKIFYNKLKVSKI